MLFCKCVTPNLVGFVMVNTTETYFPMVAVIVGYTVTPHADYIPMVNFAIQTADDALLTLQRRINGGVDVIGAVEHGIHQRNIPLKGKI